jgi:hypothetical protein
LIDFGEYHVWCSGNNKAASILLYHIVSSPYVASELLDAADAHMLLLTELSGYNLTVSTSTGSVRKTSCLNPEIKIKIHEYSPPELHLLLLFMII